MISPSFFSLFQSDGQCSLLLTAGTASPTHLELFDLQGRHLRTLLDAPLQAGEDRTVVVSALELASGLHLVRLQSGTQAKVLRIAVVK